MLNDLSLQIIENALTKLSSASMGLSLFLEIIENIYNKKDWICWRRFINNDKEQQWCLWLTNSTKPSLHLKIGCFSSAQENKANVLLNFSERETAILSRGDIKILPNMRKSTLNKDKVRMHTKKSTCEKKKKKRSHLEVWAGLDLKHTRPGNLRPDIQWYHSISVCLRYFLTCSYFELI